MFKDHFVAILCSADTLFLLNLWDLLLRQAEHTFNMLRPSCMTPTVSSYTYLWGQHDYNPNPFAPLGCKVESHLVPGIRETWAPHTASGYYVGTSWEHYRCHKVYIIDTRHTNMCSSLFFKHKYLTMPSLTPADALIRASDDLLGFYSRFRLVCENLESVLFPMRFLARTGVQFYGRTFWYRAPVRSLAF